MSNCSFVTKQNKPCKIKTKCTKSVNGTILCHIHKNYIKNQKPNDSNSVKVCSSMTKLGNRCTKKTSSVTGKCHLHCKEKVLEKKNEKDVQVKKVLEKTNDNKNVQVKKVLEKTNEKDVQPVKEINKETDCCYICLEETDKRLSCGHFIHNECLLDSIINANVKTDYRAFEHDGKYFTITKCLYCSQISIMKNIPITEKLENEYDIKKPNIKLDNNLICYYFNEIFISYDNFETRLHSNIIEEEFIREIKEFIFKKFTDIIFDDYIQQNNIKTTKKIKSKYSLINKKIILSDIKLTIKNSLYCVPLYNKIEKKLNIFLEILERVIKKLRETKDIQDDFLNLVNIF